MDIISFKPSLDPQLRCCQNGILQYTVSTNSTSHQHP